jgi:hypothetical protein
MANTRRQSAAMIDNGADQDDLANGFVENWYAKCSSVLFLSLPGP